MTHKIGLATCPSPRSDGFTTSTAGRVLSCGPNELILRGRWRKPSSVALFFPPSFFLSYKSYQRRATRCFCLLGRGEVQGRKIQWWWWWWWRRRGGWWGLGWRITAAKMNAATQACLPCTAICSESRPRLAVVNHRQSTKETLPCQIIYISHSSRSVRATSKVEIHSIQLQQGR